MSSSHARFYSLLPRKVLLASLCAFMAELPGQRTCHMASWGKRNIFQNNFSCLFSAVKAVQSNIFERFVSLFSLEGDLKAYCNSLLQDVFSYRLSKRVEVGNKPNQCQYLLHRQELHQTNSPGPSLLTSLVQDLGTVNLPSLHKEKHADIQRHF